MYINKPRTVTVLAIDNRMFDMGYYKGIQHGYDKGVSDGVKNQDDSGIIFDFLAIALGCGLLYSLFKRLQGYE